MEGRGLREGFGSLLPCAFQASHLSYWAEQPVPIPAKSHLERPQVEENLKMAQTVKESWQLSIQVLIIETQGDWECRYRFSPRTIVSITVLVLRWTNSPDFSGRGGWFIQTWHLVVRVSSDIMEWEELEEQRMALCDYSRYSLSLRMQSASRDLLKLWYKVNRFL